MVTISIEKRHVLMILGIMFLLAGGLVFAYGGSSPSILGHNEGEIEFPSDICRTNGSDCPDRLSSCEFQTINSGCGGGSRCPSGYETTGTLTDCDAWGGVQYTCGRVVCS